MRIIDADINTWTAIVECDELRLRTCWPWEEEKAMKWLEASRKVLAALKEARDVLDSTAG